MDETLVATPEMMTGSKITANKKEVIKSLEKKLQLEKCKLLKSALTEMNIMYNDSITDPNELMKSLKSTVTEKEYHIIENTYDKIAKQLDAVCEDLKSGSTTAFTKFIETAKELAVPLVDSTAVSMAFRTAILASPTIELKVAAGAGSLLYSGYRLVKNDKAKKVMDKEYEIDRMLLEIEMTKDEEGKIIDTRFSEKNQQIIRDFLKEKRVEFNDTGYLSLRQAMSKLKSDEKLQLVNVLINMNGYNMDSNKRLSKYDESFLESFKNNAVKPIAATTAAGVATATTINATVGGDVIVSSLAGTAIGSWLLDKTKNGFLSFLGGTSSGLILEGGSHIPIIGEYLDETYNTIVLGLGATLGAGIGIAGAAISSIIKAVKNSKERMKFNKEMEEMAKVEEELYLKEDQEEIIKMRDYLLNNPTPEQTAIIEMVKEYMDELGIEYRGNPKSILELRQSLTELSDSDKKKVYQLLGELEEENNKDPNQFRAALKKAGNALRNITVYGLAGLSFVDIFSGGKFFYNLNAKYVGKEEIARKAAETEVKANEVYQQMLDKGYVEDAVVKTGTARVLDDVDQNEITRLFGELTALDQNTRTFNYGAIEDATKQELLNAMEPADLYSLFLHYGDPSTQMDLLSPTKVGELRDFITNNVEIEQNNIIVQRMIDFFNEHLPEYNKNIDGMSKLIEKHDELTAMLSDYNKQLEDFNNMEKFGQVAANVATPIVAYEEYENKKQK